jgi:hypothetical protein
MSCSVSFHPAMRRVIALPILGLLMLAQQGCIVASAVEGVGTITIATVKTAGQVAGAAVKATGHVAASTVSASGEVADTSVKTAAQLSREGAVVFFDPKSGTVWQTPWSAGLKMLAASQAAKVDVAFEAARVIRGARVAAQVASRSDVTLKAGDVVELAKPASL